MKEQKFVEYLNPKDGKTYLVTEHEDRRIKLFSARFVFVLSFALMLYFTNYIDLIYIVLLSVLLIVVLEFLNFKFRVKLFSERFPIDSKTTLPRNTKYNTSRSIIYFIIGGSIIAYTVNQYGMNLDIYTIIMYAIGVSFMFQSYKLKNK